MNVISGLFLCFFVISLVTGTAYSRGAIRREDDPVNYWATTVGYLVIGLLISYPWILQKLKGH